MTILLAFFHLLFAQFAIPFPGFASASSPVKTIVCHTGFTATSTTTSSMIDCSGATVLIWSINNFSNIPDGFTDSSSNTYVKRANNPGGNCTGGGSAGCTDLNGLGQQLYIYSLAPTVSNAMTFTWTCVGCAGAVQVIGVSGVTAFDLDNGGANPGSNMDWQWGPVTASFNNSLVLSSALVTNAGPTLTGVDSGCNISDTNVSGSVFGGSLCSIIQVGMPAVDPKWSFSSGISSTGANIIFH